MLPTAIPLLTLGLAAFLAGPVQGAKQKWPDVKHNELESLWLEGGVGIGYPSQMGFIRNFNAFLSGCAPGPRSTAAQWVRLAYHDSATHNVNGDGLGGLDQSIRFELDRAENVGNGMTSTLADFAGLNSKHVSTADVIALGVIHAVATCRGPAIPFHSGRVDATEAGPAGVPEPHQSLEEHTEIFGKQGFNATEMIELVACGHTVGAVHHNDFPDLVDRIPDPNGEEGDFIESTTFDTTPEFDNAIATEFLDGTTQNVLVKHANTTMLSDLRIFTSDGNTTMNKLSDPQVFQNRCRELLARMIDTVPRDVQLSEVFEAIDVKVGPSFLTFNTTLRLHTDLRFLTSNPNRNVTLKWTSRNDNSTVLSAGPWSVTNRRDALAAKLGHEIVHYWFSPEINATSSIAKFWFEVDEGQGGVPDVYDNDGAGYPILQDTLVFAVDHTVPSNKTVMAIRNDRGPISGVSANIRFISSSSGVTVDETHNLTLDAGLPSVGGFDFYSVAPRPELPPFSFLYHTHFDVTATVGGEVVTETDLEDFYVRRQEF